MSSWTLPLGFPQLGFDRDGDRGGARDDLKLGRSTAAPESAATELERRSAERVHLRVVLCWTYSESFGSEWLVGVRRDWPNLYCLYS